MLPETFQNDLRQFLTPNRRNEWVEDEGIKVYLRITHRYLEGNPVYGDDGFFV